MDCNKLVFRTDRVGDILYVDRCAPYAEIANLEVLFFSRRLMGNELLELPIDGDLRLVS